MWVSQVKAVRELRLKRYNVSNNVSNSFSSYPTISSLIEHLQSAHSYQVKIQSAQFSDLISFSLWKEKEEKRTHSNYVQQCAPQFFGDKQHWYYTIATSLESTRVKPRAEDKSKLREPAS